MTRLETQAAPGADGTTTGQGRPGPDIVTRMLRRALDEMASEPPLVVADWIAQVVDPQRPSSVVLLGDTQTSLPALAQAKDLYKLLRVIGKTAALRRMGRRMYAATIAAAIVHHQVRISGQSDGALGRAFHYLTGDEEIPQPVREIVARAATLLPYIKRADEVIPDLEAMLKPEMLVPPPRTRSTAAPAGKAPTQQEPKEERRTSRRGRRLATREARRVKGAYDPVLGASFQRQQAYCPACRDVVEVRRKLPNRSLHLWVSLLTLGIWLPIWGLLELATHLHSWRCVNCRRKIYHAMLS